MKNYTLIKEVDHIQILTNANNTYFLNRNNYSVHYKLLKKGIVIHEGMLKSKELLNVKNLKEATDIAFPTTSISVSSIDLKVKDNIDKFFEIAGNIIELVFDILIG